LYGPSASGTTRWFVPNGGTKTLPSNMISMPGGNAQKLPNWLSRPTLSPMVMMNEPSSSSYFASFVSRTSSKSVAMARSM
jgi:hypothetical protein